MNSQLYNQAYFHAVRRAILENENLMKAFMENVAIKYDNEKLERFDRLLVSIFDNDLYDIIMAQKTPEFFSGVYDVDLLEEIAAYAVGFSGK